jgi:hypothetical protein
VDVPAQVDAGQEAAAFGSDDGYPLELLDEVRRVGSGRWPGRSRPDPRCATGAVMLGFAYLVGNATYCADPPRPLAFREAFKAVRGPIHAGS